MSLTTDFVSELYYAGNRAGKLTPLEARRLLERGVVMLREMKEMVPPDALPGMIDDRLAIIVDFANDVAGLPPQFLAHGLIDAADLITTLTVEIDRQA